MSASVRATSTASPAGNAAGDLALLRAAPTRGRAAPSGNGAAQTAPARHPAPGTPGEAQPGGAGDVRGGALAGAPTPTTTTDAGGPAAPARSSTFGETLAASMSASPVSTPANPTTTPARGTKAKPAEKSADAQSASAAQAVAALLLPGSAPAAAAPTTPGTAAGAATQAPSGDAVGAINAETRAADGVPTDPAASDTSAAPAAPAPPEALAATTNSTGAAPDTVARAGQGPSFTAAALLGAKPAPQAPASDRSAPGGESDGESAETTAPVNPATAAPIVPPHAAPLPLVAGHDLSGSQANAQPGPFTDKSADLSAAQAALGGASAAGNAAQPAAAPAPQTTVTVPVHAEVGSGAWAQELGVRLNWMAQAGISSASLRLTPAQLGPVEVKISVHQNTASVWFGAAQPDTRSALEQALPKLREMFSSQGLNLAHTGVSDQSARGAERQAQSATVLAPAALRELNATPVTPAARILKGLVDTYA